MLLGEYRTDQADDAVTVRELSRSGKMPTTSLRRRIFILVPKNPCCGESAFDAACCPICCPISRAARLLRNRRADLRKEAGTIHSSMSSLRVGLALSGA